MNFDINTFSDKIGQSILRQAGCLHRQNCGTTSDSLRHFILAREFLHFFSAFLPALRSWRRILHAEAGFFRRTRKVFCTELPPLGRKFLNAPASPILLIARRD
jgi:hypothetical protein